MVSGGNNIVMLAKEALAFLLFMVANKSSCEGGSGYCRFGISKDAGGKHRKMFIWDMLRLRD